VLEHGDLISSPEPGAGLLSAKEESGFETLVPISRIKSPLSPGRSRYFHGSSNRVGRKGDLLQEAASMFSSCGSKLSKRKRGVIHRYHNWHAGENFNRCHSGFEGKYMEQEETWKTPALILFIFLHYIFFLLTLPLPQLAPNGEVVLLLSTYMLLYIFGHTFSLQN
jgi:hypothetical protein